MLVTVEGLSSLGYAEDFARLAEQLLTEKQEQPTLDRIVRLAVQTLDPCDYCAVAVRVQDGGLTAAAVTGPIAAQVIELQSELGEGPSFEITSGLGTVNVDDMRAEPRWPRWAPAAAELGIGSMLTLRLDITNPSETASLNLLAVAPAAFDSGDFAIASIFARHAASAIGVVRKEEGLRAAARSRQVIGVAQGLLMQRFGLTLDQSFELLRRYSQTHNIKLRVLAERLAAAGRIPTSGDGADGLARALGLNAPEQVQAAAEGSEPETEAG